ncbi:putative TRAF3-interacting protein 1 [Hypsibius exemplaris]|uniref:TRAF3-interacting protein 1 n=1 Tax=Hypsibius exemplaris TaxID=2072580 RepID=A0A1W0XEL6_HYPEX|nr:putative TRAF3-interacting protein 1 [Hypsibius exemplaris]
MEDDVRRTQETLGTLLTSPILTEKLLQKPPLRFLHDIFVAITKEYPLMRGLFDEDEMAWAEKIANDKDAKLFFIAKVVNFVSVASGSDIPTRSSKVCSGMEADKTNLLLQCLARLIKGKVDDEVVIQRVKSGGGPERLETFAKGPPFLLPSKANQVEAKPSARVETKPKHNLLLSNKVQVPPDTAVKGTVASTNPSKAPLTATKPTKEITGVVDTTKTTVTPPATLTSTRPTTARRAPERPPTAKSNNPQTAEMTRRDTFVKVKSNSDEEKEEKEVVAAPPTGIRFLSDEDKSQPQEMVSYQDPQDNNGIIHSRLLELGYDSSGNRQGNDPSGQLVSHLRETQKTFVENNGYAEDEGANNNVIGQQEMICFKKDVEELRGVLQRVSRLTDILSTQMQILPEDFEEMNKDRQRYLEEMLTLHQQINEATKVEEGEMDKLRREQSLQEEVLFVIEEEIASTQYRIKEKEALHDKLKGFTSRTT